MFRRTSTKRGPRKGCVAVIEAMLLVVVQLGAVLDCCYLTCQIINILPAIELVCFACECALRAVA